MRNKNRISPRLKKLLPKKKKERLATELFAGTAASALVVCIFLASSADLVMIRSDQYASVIAAVLTDLANGDRNAQSVAPLTVNPLLVEAAQEKANDMAAKSYFAHVSPQGVDPWHWFQAVGYSFDYAGENLAVDFTDSSDVNNAWMNSPTHRENILDPHYTEIGIATAEGSYEGHPTTYVVEEFGAPSQKSAPIVAETIPTNPTSIASAHAAVPAHVLGATKTNPSSAVPVPQKQTVIPTRTAAPLPVPAQSSWLSFAVTSPRTMMQYAYTTLAVIVILVLMVVTGLEFELRHRRKAFAAGFVLALICALFIVSGQIIFPVPTLPSQSSMTAAAGLGF